MFKVELEGLEDLGRELGELETPEGVALFLNEHHATLVCPTHGSSPVVDAHGRDDEGNVMVAITFCCDELRALYEAERAAGEDPPVDVD
jgi:hypothetical protein